MKNAFITPIANNCVSLLAALMVFGTVFAVLHTGRAMQQSDVIEIMRTSGPASTGLTFIWMPQLFAQIFMGRPLAILFFLGLSFAGFSSLIAQLELPVRVFIDRGLKRSRAIILVVLVTYLLGIPSARSLNILQNQDFVWGYALILVGALLAVAVIRYGAARLRKEELASDPNDWKLGRWWDVVLAGFVPSAAIILLVWWFVQEAKPGQWYNPLDPTSVMNCLLQWAIVLGVLLLINRWLSTRSPQINVPNSN